LEPIKALVEQKVPDRQICLIYGWVEQVNDGKGKTATIPQLWKLREEIEKPGMHTGEGFVPPAEQRRLDAEEKAKKIIEDIREAQGRKLEKLAAPPPESLEKLIVDGVSARQIAEILHCGIEEVYRRCKDLKLTPPPEHYDLTPPAESVNAKAVKAEPAVRVLERPKIAAGADSDKLADIDEGEDGIADNDGDYDGADDDAVPHGDLSGLDVEDQVIALHQQGFDHEAICNSVGMGKRRVWNIIKKWQADQEQAEVAAT
jgi:hypothetical protein